MRKSEEVKKLILEATVYGNTYKITGILDAWAEEVVDKCIEVIAEHCKQSREQGQIASPEAMERLLKKVKDML